jgi:Na+(H+)/acetate symporter ActP
MFPVAASLVDVLHALLMLAWVAGLPLLFSRRFSVRFPRATRTYALYAVVFVAVNQVCELTLGGCPLTLMSRKLWSYGLPNGAVPEEWFSVRLAHAVFHASPSRSGLTILFSVLVSITALGVLVSLRGGARGALRARHP